MAVNAKMLTTIMCYVKLQQHFNLTFFLKIFCRFSKAEDT